MKTIKFYFASLLMLLPMALLATENIVISYQLPLFDTGQENILTSYPVNIDASSIIDNSNAITSGNLGLADNLDITLPNGSLIHFSRDFDHINYSNGKNAHWSGKQLGGSNGIASLTLIKALVRDEVDRLFGIIKLDNATYQFNINSLGQQVLNIVDESLFECGVESVSNNAGGDKRGQIELPGDNSNSTLLAFNEAFIAGANGNAEMTVIDIGVLYTPIALSFSFADVGALEGAALNAVNIANVAFANSSISNVMYDLVGVEGLSPTLGNSCDQNTGACSLLSIGNAFEVIEFRNDTNADLVTVLQEFNVETTTGDTMGIAHLPGSTGNINPFACRNSLSEQCYINKIRTDSFGMVFNYAHELGHNLGLFHDANDPGAIPGSSIVIPNAPNARGLRTNNTATTMVATASCEQAPPCQRIDSFSNAPGIADSVTGIRNSAPIVSRYEVPEQPDELININNFSLSGVWDIDQGSNQGIVFESNPQVNDGFIFGAWFTYIDAFDNGQNTPATQRWFTISAEGPFVNNQAQVIIRQSIGGVFDDPTPTTNAQVGTGVLSFTSCRNGQLDFDFNAGTNNGSSGTIDLIRIGPSIDCDENSASNTGTGFIDDFGLSGSWFDPATAGQGFQIEVNPEIDFFFAGWFTFSNNSGGVNQQRWYTIDGSYDEEPIGNSVTAPINQFTGGRFNSLDSVIRETVGQATVTFTDCRNATVQYSFDNGQQGFIQIQKIGPNVVCTN